jgi:hypothetical protein
MENRAAESWLQAGEVIALQVPANHTEGSGARGGRLWLTDRRLIFSPHALDKGLGANRVDIPLSHITNAGKEAAGCGPQAWFSGGLRARLRIEVADGSKHLFVVNKLDTVIVQIRQHLTT